MKMQISNSQHRKFHSICRRQFPFAIVAAKELNEAVLLEIGPQVIRQRVVVRLFVGGFRKVTHSLLKESYIPGRLRPRQTIEIPAAEAARRFVSLCGHRNHDKKHNDCNSDTERRPIETPAVFGFQNETS